MSNLSVNHLLGIKYLNSKDLKLIFETTDHFKEVINRKIKKVPSLRDVTIANLFFENSTRTKISFELAQKRLSADVINFSSSASSVSKGETLIDTVNNILSMKVDMVIIRHPSPGASVFLANNVDNTKLSAIYGGKFDSKGVMKSHFATTVYDLIQQHGVPKDKTDAILIPLELELSIDGIGGIFPGNAYHSDYIPARYQEETLFQCFDVNHTVDGSGWTVNLSGKMRTTLQGLFKEPLTSDDRLKEVIDAYSSGKVKEKQAELNARQNDPGLSAGQQGPVFIPN